MRLPPYDRLLYAGRPEARLHTMAWGTDYPYYGALSHAIDSYSYDCIDSLVVIAAGNREGNKLGGTNGIDHRSNRLTDPANSKNALVGE